MKNLNFCRLALVFSGCFLGAGYVSGQELLQYFAAFGKNGSWGLLLAMLILLVFGFIIVRTAQLSGSSQADKVILPWNAPRLGLAVVGLEVIFMFGIVTIMSAGVGALLQQRLGLSHVIGSGLFCALLLLIALAGLQGIVSAFSISVPLLVTATLGFGIYALATGGISAPSLAVPHNGLLGNWVISSVNFSFYNLFATVAILAPFGANIRRPRTIAAGIALGTAALFLVAASVLLSLSAWPEACAAELPMLSAAETLGSFAADLYALLLFAAMFGTALSSFVGIINYFSEKYTRFARKSRLFSAVLAIVVFAASLAGFGDLISILYPLFGYASAVFLILLLINFIRLRFFPAKRAMKSR